MSAPLPSAKAYVPFVSVDNMMRLVRRIGLADLPPRAYRRDRGRFPPLAGFRQDAPACRAFGDGVIELMPTSDGERYSFKYVNGHPKNAAEGLQTVTAIGMLADVASGYPRTAQRNDAADRAAHRGDLGAGDALTGAKKRTNPGADRQWRPGRVPGAGAAGGVRNQDRAPLRYRRPRDGEDGSQSQKLWP